MVEDDDEEEMMVEDEPRPAPSPPAREEEDEEEEMPAPPRESEERPSEAGEPGAAATAELAPSLAPPRAAGLRSREELALELEWTLRALDQRMAFLESQRARAAG